MSWPRDRYPGPGGGLYTGPAGGLYTGPGGGLYSGAGGGLYVGATSTPYSSNWPPIARLLQELANRGLASIANQLIRDFGLS